MPQLNASIVMPQPLTVHINNLRWLKCKPERINPWPTSNRFLLYLKASGGRLRVVSNESNFTAIWAQKSLWNSPLTKPYKTTVGTRKNVILQYCSVQADFRVSLSLTFMWTPQHLRVMSHIDEITYESGLE